jgi:hypothetical protein
MNAAIEEYCERLTAGEKDEGGSAFTQIAPTATTVAAYAQNLLGSKSTAPKDIEDKVF